MVLRLRIQAPDICNAEVSILHELLDQRDGQCKPDPLDARRARLLVVALRARAAQTLPLNADLVSCFFHPVDFR